MFGQKCYGKMGDQVKLIADKGNVLIVEALNDKKTRFPVPAEEVEDLEKKADSPGIPAKQVRSTTQKKHPPPLPSLF